MPLQVRWPTSSSSRGSTGRQHSKSAPPSSVPSTAQTPDLPILIPRDEPPPHGPLSASSASPRRRPALSSPLINFKKPDNLFLIHSNIMLPLPTRDAKMETKRRFMKFQPNCYQPMLPPYVLTKNEKQEGRYKLDVDFMLAWACKHTDPCHCIVKGSDLHEAVEMQRDSPEGMEILLDASDEATLRDQEGRASIVPSADQSSHSALGLVLDSYLSGPDEQTAPTTSPTSPSAASILQSYFATPRTHWDEPTATLGITGVVPQQAGVLEDHDISFTPSAEPSELTSPSTASSYIISPEVLASMPLPRSETTSPRSTKMRRHFCVALNRYTELCGADCLLSPACRSPSRMNLEADRAQARVERVREQSNESRPALTPHPAPNPEPTDSSTTDTSSEGKFIPCVPQ
ncbi:hypothetical protein CBOM_05025 [Ceraceosorus bombacis]|uniref:Uncharacterized protein n=1 Tax=Ceraceosorus bombacis TaxID=401625 RepID=A0A0P1BI71_9BASI|nr:hypothetical protein CBOM_05025 [Ceraceosorus bombacis]